MEEPFTRIQMRPLSKWFILNVATLGFFTKWFLPKSKNILKKGEEVPYKQFWNDVLNFELDQPNKKSSTTESSDKDPLLHVNRFSDNGKQKCLKRESKSLLGKIIDGTKEWFYLWMWFMSTRRAKLIEKMVFDFYLVLILAWYSIVGQTYKYKALDIVLWCFPIMILSRNFRFMFCSFFKVDEYRKHPFRLTQFSVTQYGYIVQFFSLMFCKLTGGLREIISNLQCALHV